MYRGAGIVARDLRRMPTAPRKANSWPRSAVDPAWSRELRHAYWLLDASQRLMPESTAYSSIRAQLGVGESRLVERRDVLLELLDAARADHQRRHPRVAQRPRQAPSEPATGRARSAISFEPADPAEGRVVEHALVRACRR